MKLNVGDPAPDFFLKATQNRTVRLADYQGKTVVLAFYPLAWTPVCTHQIPSYEADIDKFDQLNAQVFGISVDHVPCLEAWAESLGGISYPLLSDFWPHGEVASQYGVLRPDGRSERAIFVIDKDGIIRYIDIHDINEQPRNQELFDAIMEMDPDGTQRFANRPPVGEMPTGDVVMYCTSWCLDCKKAKKWLDSHGIEYVEVDVNDYPEAGKLVRSWANGDLVTPTFNIHGKIIVDFDLPKLKEAFSIKA